MIAKKGQEVPVEVTQVVMFWTCPNCGKENHEDWKRNGGVEELECQDEECSTVIVKQGEVRWLVQ